MKKTNLKKIFLFLILYSFFFILSSKAHTQMPTGIRSITISPPSIELDLNPGEKTEGVLRILNRSEEAVTFNVGVRDYVVNDNMGTPVLLPDDSVSDKFSAAAWITAVPNTFTIQPKQRQELSYYLEVPSD